MNYKSRIIDKQFDERMKAFGGGLFVRPKRCEKTTTPKQKAKTVIEFQNEEIVVNNGIVFFF